MDIVKLNALGNRAAGIAPADLNRIFKPFYSTRTKGIGLGLPITERIVKAMNGRIEIASSPLQNINDHGPAVVASDFGNNAGLLLGAEVPDWQTRPLESLDCEARIDNVVVGRGGGSEHW